MSLVISGTSIVRITSPETSPPVYTGGAPLPCSSNRRKETGRGAPPGESGAFFYKKKLYMKIILVHRSYVEFIRS